MQKITPCLWFNGQVEEALDFYTSVFDSARVKDVSYYDKGSPMGAGAILTATFDIEGQEFMILNGGPQFTFNEAISFVVHCNDQEEIDYYWNNLTANGGQESMCGWLKDRYGISWQIVPAMIAKLMAGTEPEKSARAFQALMQMKKIDIATLETAYKG